MGAASESVWPVLGRLWREPLLHFVVLGGAIFLLQRPDPAPGASRVIEVTPEVVESLKARHAQALGRPLSEAELDHVLQGYLREEVLVREAMALELDQGDTVVRQRLRLKMDLLAEGAAAGLSPTEAELRAWHAAKPEAFVAPPAFGFRQVMIDEAADAPKLLAALRAGTEPEEVGRAGLLPPAMAGATAEVIDRTFGPGFAEGLAGLAVGDWGGPVASAYGLHLVRLDARDEGASPPFEAVRDRVELAWRRDAAERLREAQVEALMDRYEVVRAGGEGP